MRGGVGLRPEPRVLSCVKVILTTPSFVKFYLTERFRSPTPRAPFAKVRTFGAERRVVAVAGIDDRRVRVDVEHPASHIGEQLRRSRLSSRSFRRRRGTGSRR